VEFRFVKLTLEMTGKIWVSREFSSM